MNLITRSHRVAGEVGLILAALALAGSLGWVYYESHRPKAFEFAGIIEAVGEGSLQVRGYFLADGNPLGPEDGAEIVIGPESRIVRTYLLMPTEAELTESGGRWDPSALSTRTEQVNIEALRGREGTPVRVTTAVDVLNAERFEAATVEYVEQIYPEE